MSDLDPAHVEAVTRVLGDAYLANFEPNFMPTNALTAAILTSTDPDVHEALLAALVRAGVLDVEARVREAYREGVRHGSDELDPEEFSDE